MKVAGAQGKERGGGGFDECGWTGHPRPQADPGFGPGGRGLEDWRVQRRMQWGRHTGSTSGRGGRKKSSWETWEGAVRPTRDGFREKRRVRELKAAPGPVVLVFRSVSVWTGHGGGAHVSVTQKPGCDR